MNQCRYATPEFTFAPYFPLICGRVGSKPRRFNVADEKQMCMGCGTRPAVSSNGTLPLCSQCAAVAQEKKRGVEYDKDKAPDTLRNP
jgi:hypothetical protein